MVGGSRSGKTQYLVNLINQHADIDNIYLHKKDPNESKYQYVIDKRKRS